MPFAKALVKTVLLFISESMNGTTSAYGLMSILGGIPPFLDDPYFALPPPKSTGREHFNLDWLREAMENVGIKHLPPHDVQATLCELTASSITRAISDFAPQAQQILVCGGGVHNKTLFQRLVALNNSREVAPTTAFGIDPDWVEAMAFAWLAKRTLEGKPGNLPSVTGARREVVLGGIYPGRNQST